MGRRLAVGRPTTASAAGLPWLVGGAPWRTFVAPPVPPASASASGRPRLRWPPDGTTGARSAMLRRVAGAGGLAITHEWLGLFADERAVDLHDLAHLFQQRDDTQRVR